VKRLQPDAGEPRQRHWVPQVYLKGFTHNGSKKAVCQRKARRIMSL
jgi:hypothetical protein